MAPVQNFSETDLSKFSLLTTKLLSLTQGRVCEKTAINACLTEINLLDYRCFAITNNSAVMLLINHLCKNIQTRDTLLVKNYSYFIVNIMRAGMIIEGRTFSSGVRWLLEALEYSAIETRNDVLAALQSLLNTGPYDIINRSLQNLLGERGLLRKLVNSSNNDWSETNFLALSCIEAILVNRENSGGTISPDYRRILKEMVLNVLSSLSYDHHDKLFYNKMVACGLRILCRLVVDKTLTSESPDSVGEILGIVKTFLFHGIKGYSPMKPQCLRPAAMNLPEVVQSRGNNPKNKTRPKRQTPKKSSQDEKTNSLAHENLPLCCKYSSDSDTESFNPAQVESKVRLEAIHLLHAATQEISARDMFGYWPQIVASGSRDSARVLTRSVLKEPVSKVRRSVLGTLTKLLVSAKHFLIHADDSEHPSFLTFFGTVGAMIRELHLALALVLSCERNSTVLTHALKCAAGLVQGSPYARLKPGLATKLSRHCRPHMLHKDPTVRVSALSVFEAFASLDPLTPEIINILEKESRLLIDKDFPQLNHSSTSGFDDDDNDDDQDEVNAVEFDDLSYESEVESEMEVEPPREKGVSCLLQVCLKYISNEAERGPVRLHALKLLTVLASNVEDLVFAHLKIVTATLATATQEADVQVARHSCRVIETIAGRLANSCHENVNIAGFWNIVFAPVIALVQHSQTALREVACDCLGNIGSTMFSQLPRERSILIITVLFGAVRDEESAVRAAAIRALGMLVTLQSLEDDTGFLMDLADIVCHAIDDQNLGVRVKACWALANLCDCLIRLKDNSDIEPLPLDVLLPRLYNTTVKAAEDKSKVKCNAMRAVGSVIRMCSDRRVLEDTSRGLEVLIKCATLENDMKVRWNACRALGFVISYKPDAVLPSSWRDNVFPTLCNLICHSPNFKVRTNAAWALASCESYEKSVSFLWKSIVVALENSQHVPNFVEYPHRDALVQQLCLTLSHLASCTETSDLQSVWIEIRDHVDDISSHIKHLHNRVLPEKADDLVKARTHLQRLIQTTTNSEDKRIAKNLADLFIRKNLYDDIGQM